MRVVVRAAIGNVVSLRSSEIEHLEVIQALGEHVECLLFFTRDKDTDLSLENMLGERLVVTLEDDLGVVPIFEGPIEGGSQNHQVNHGSAFSIEARSKSAVLERRSTVYFPKSKFSDVVSRMGAKISGNPPSGEELEYVQFGETDFSFLLRLADENGMFIRTTSNQIELRSEFEEVGPTLVWGRDLLGVTAQARPSNNGNSGVSHEYQFKRDHRFRGVRKDPQWLSGAARLTAASQRVANRQHSEDGDAMWHELPHRSKKLEDGRIYLEQESMREQGISVLVDCVANNLRIRAGDTVTLAESEAFALPTRGKLGVIRVSHQFDGHLYSNTFTATPWANWTNRTRPARSHIDGPTTATVVDNVDPEKMGRLKVRMRWLDEGQASRWVRMMQPHSGNQRGVLFLPEIGDEVVVAFELGDPERPMIIGAMWNGKDEAMSMEKNYAKRIVTRSGNTVQFYDYADKKEIVEMYSATGDTWVQLNNNGGKPILTIHSEGDISIEAKNEIRLKCKILTERVSDNAYRKTGGNDSSEIGGDFIRKVKGAIKLDGASVLVKAGGMLDAVAGGIHSILGSMVHIQPPGKMVPPVMVSAHDDPKSLWAATPVPKDEAEKTSADAKTRG